MPTTPSPRQIRAARIAQLRRRVLATALATFALAVGAVAYDGSTGETAASTAPTAVVHASTADTTAPSDTTAASDATAADDVVSTRQS
jgi:hypothetical protein